jgi:catechol 2,3-dioxygenase-like lactoylglutathione lyase family enzyme
MKLGYTILYVPDVRASLRFYEQAFGLSTKFLHEVGDFGELDTGSTSLAFCSQALLQQLGKPQGGLTWPVQCLRWPLSLLTCLRRLHGR